jgi:uncharacterized membrane protein
VSALFPIKKQGEGISVIERIGLSLVTSLAIIPLFGLALNFSPWGIRLMPLLLVVCLFIFGVGSIALYRWYMTSTEERFSFTFNVTLPVFENRIDKVVTLVLAVLIITSIVLLVYMIVIPRVGEKFTEFYILGVNGTTDRYPQNLSIGENSIIIGITNHEYRDITYTVEVWLVNQTISYNTSEMKNETVVNHMWFIDEIIVKLNHSPVDLETFQKPQWENITKFSIPIKGDFKLEFLLFTTPTEHYNTNWDYKDMAEQILTSAYRELHLWVTVS